MFVQTGNDVGIGGFIVTGQVPKRVIVRAIGPSLIRFNVPNALADPVLELHGPAGFFATIVNDNWRDSQETAIGATGLAPTDDRESAIDATLAPGAYTGIVRGKNGATGVALFEVYDIEPNGGTNTIEGGQPSDSRLGNISTRANVGTAGNVVIAGFILGNNSGQSEIIVRGIGPSLAARGVPTPLADPTLELHNADGALIRSNNDWQDVPAEAAQVSAAGLAPTNIKESAMAVMLQPGLYTVFLIGVNNGTGNGLVEVYDLSAAPTLIPSP